eukprot:c25395_g1_i3 orf=20-2872(-)
MHVLPSLCTNNAKLIMHFITMSSIRGALSIWQALLFFSSSTLLPTCSADGNSAPPSSVPVGSYLPPQGDSNSVVLVSPNGMFNLNVETWRSSYCMVTSTCRLFLSEHGDLLLQLDGNNTAWQTHTAGMGVSNLTLQDNGNLVLHTKQGLTVWQSFAQSPAFDLNSGMKLTPNITIYSWASPPDSTSFSVPGNFGMRLHDSNLVLFTNTNDTSQFVYWSTSFTSSSPHANTEQVAYVALDDALTFYDNTSQALGSVAPAFKPPYNVSSALRVALLDPPSANLLAFYRDEKSGTWVQFYNSSIGACQTPNHCGQFSLCNASNGVCSCPPGFHQNATRDCEPETDLSFGTASCSSADASLYKFVSVNVSFPPQLSPLPASSIQDCKSLCLKQCTCKTALFDPATSSCSLFSSLQTVLSRADSNQLMLLKIATGRHSSKTRLAAILGASIVASLCSICALAAICWCKRRRRKSDSSSREAPNVEVFLQALPRLPPRYTYKELEAATKEFSKKLGAGGFGAVYEGVLPSGVMLAVKKLEDGSGQSSGQFRAEVASIGSVSHMNLVTLKGFCHEGNARLLVYEHMRRGSLDKWLFGEGEEGGMELGWERRCKIALDTAKGLAYLHHECGERIVHCDVKPENILLDEEFNAKVGDFGLAKLVGRERQSFAMTTLKGTRGYLAPEWLQDASITAKSDVYSFGVVLLELISGRRCIDSDYGYLPTLAFRIASMASSTSTNSGSYNKPQDSHWKQGMPFSSNPCPDPPKSITEFDPRSHERVTGSTRYLGSKRYLSSPGNSVSSNTAPPLELITSSSKSTERDTSPMLPSSSSSSSSLPPPREHAIPPPMPSHPPPHHANRFDPSSMAAFLDARLSCDADVSLENLERMIFIGLWCLQSSPSVRPSMNVVVQMLEGVVAVPPPPLQAPLAQADDLFTLTSTSSALQSRACFTSTEDDCSM